MNERGTHGHTFCRMVFVVFFNRGFLLKVPIPRSVNYDLVETSLVFNWRSSEITFFRLQELRSVNHSSVCLQFLVQSFLPVPFEFFVIMLESWGLNVWFSLSS